MANTIYLVGDVVSGYTFPEMLSKYEALGEVNDLLIVINSAGGSVSEGLAIYEWIKQLGKDGVSVTARATGMCASIASVILCAAPRRQATPYASIHPHNPWVPEFSGDSKAFGEMSEALAVIENKLERIYSIATGKDIQAVSNLLSLDKTMTASEAFDFGIVNEILIDNEIEAKVKDLLKDITHSKTVFAKLDVMADKKKGWKATIASILNSSEDVQNAVFSLADGTSISTDSEGAIAVGQMVTYTESGEAVPDGSHELSDGSVIVTEGGVITELTEATSEPQDSVSREEFNALKAKLDSMEAANAEKLGDVQDSIEMLAKSLVKAKLTTTKEPTIPSKDSNSKHKKPDPKAAKRSALEEYLNNKKK